MEDSDARSVGSSATGISTLSARIASLAVYEDRAGYRPGIAEADEFSQPEGAASEEEEEELVEMTEEQVADGLQRCRGVSAWPRAYQAPLAAAAAGAGQAGARLPGRDGPSQACRLARLSCWSVTPRLQVCSRLFRTDGGALACKQLSAEQLQSLQQQGCARP